MMGNDDIESDAFTEILDMAHSNEFKVIIKEYSDLLNKLAVANNLTPQELAGLIYFANERLSSDVSMMFLFYSMDFMGEDKTPISLDSPHRMKDLIGDLLTKMDRIPEDAKVLGFFLEHPFHTFDIPQIARYLGISRDVVKTNLNKFVDLGYIVKTADEDSYKLKCSKEMLQILIETLIKLPDILKGDD